MSAPESIQKLVSKFRRDEPGSETEVRIQFVDPLFTALGWDLRDKRQVRHEPRVTIQEDGVARSKRPDYSFHAGGRPRFYLETKQPRHNLQRNAAPAYQLRRYGWSGTCAVSVLTDFEEFCVYDCRIQPEPRDTAATARLSYYEYGEYVDKWAEIEARFSYEAVAAGSLEKWVEGERVRGVESVDQAFLREMENWRESLAGHIALHNRRLSQRQLNLLVQRTIDRIVFLRIAEDRDIEAYGRLLRAAARENVYAELKLLFHEADDKYNSGLFHFGADSRASQPDQLSLNVSIPDEPLREIIRSLYFPRSPYEFSVLPADILGQVYERFLGKVIEFSPGGAVAIQEKPEVRKAGGVYYTPTYIVDYIVENTVGALLEGATPEDAARLRILDPACGSGSFLSGAYQYLLDWHLAYYRGQPARYRNRILDIAGEGISLKTAEKRRILQNNIYGVDLDENAVEVSKLSLLLKMLERESEATGAQTLMFSAGGRILPDLSDNIKWGNSLIGSDFYRGAQGGLFADEEEMLRVKAFDWASAGGFPEVMRASGFDAVIGNPPYVRQETLGRDFKDYAKRKFETYAGMADLYTYFIERGVKLLRENGLFGIIVANKWMRARYGKPLRTWLKKQAVIEIVDFGALPVFEQATTYPCILRIANDRPRGVFNSVQVENLEFSSLQEYVSSASYEVLQNALDDNGWSLAERSTQELYLKIVNRGVPLTKYVDGKIHYGIKTGRNSAFIIDSATKSALIQEDSSSADVIKPFLMGRDIFRYADPQAERYVIFTRRGVDIENYPAIKSYLSQYRDILEPKPTSWRGAWRGRKPGSYAWYEIQDAVDYYEEFERHKIIVPCIVKSASYLFDTNGFYSNDKTTIIVSDDLYLYGLLNSKVLDFVMHQISSTKQGGYFEYKPMYLAKLPIRTIDFDNPADVQMHDKMVELVDEMLDLHNRLPGLAGEGRRITEALINTVDNEIDALVYELYGLTVDEIAIVEE